MSSGPGKLQRRLLTLLAINNPFALPGPLAGLTAWRWTSGDLIMAMSGGRPGHYLRRREVQRQVRRALMGLVRQGLVARSWQSDSHGYRWALPDRIPPGTWTHRYDDALVFRV